MSFLFPLLTPFISIVIYGTVFQPIREIVTCKQLQLRTFLMINFERPIPVVHKFAVYYDIQEQIKHIKNPDIST